MRIQVLAVGVRMPAWVQEAWKDYAKRLPHDCALELIEIKPEPRISGKTPAQLMQAEALRIEAAAPAQAWRVVLDEHGRDLDTMTLARHLESWRGAGRDVAFLIGGPDGLDPALKQRGHQTIRLSSLTLPHPMVRVLLAEQIYRAWAILAGHPYHRA
ncbi:23S rRNA (pseudouridine(1915)-N(3))-methyltransferase RlmH [Castellaniella sp. GW247-6E4]|uniref:23S rRNA (pseudouridine(1915)-N(3))-methyltransferase RlmH n=1 Tax=Castellaniella sp. GW247-6E4 TaxID=3140380 RepID=UPI003314B856